MNLTRKLLDSLGITESDKQDTIIEAYTEKTDALKALQAQFDATKAENDTLKKSGADAATEKARADKAEKDLADFKALTAAGEKRRKVEEAYKGLLRDANIDEKRFGAILRVTDFDKMTLKDDGTLDGADKLTESIQSEWADFIVSSDLRGSTPPTPPAGKPGTDDLAAVRAAMGLPATNGG